jgi:hypothetical protein
MIAVEESLKTKTLQVTFGGRTANIFSFSPCSDNSDSACGPRGVQIMLKEQLHERPSADPGYRFRAANSEPGFY